MKVLRLSRFKMAVVVLTAVVVSTTASHGAIVYFDLGPNYVTPSDDSNFSATLGPGIDLVAGTTLAANQQALPPFMTFSDITLTVGFSAETVGFYIDDTMAVTISVGQTGFDQTLDATGNSAAVVNGYFLVQFTHAAVNSGVATNGMIEISANGSGRVDLGDIFFDDANATRSASDIVAGAGTATEFIPEPSSLSFLLMGVAGLLARRHRIA